MSNDRSPPTIQKTQWTDALLEDLFSALRANRDDATVRAFARELMDDKDLPLDYLLHKIGTKVGAAQADRLEVLVRGRHAMDKRKAEQAKSTGGVLGMVRKFFR